MKIYYSTKLPDTTSLPGCHLVQDHIGTKYPNPWNDLGYYVTFKAYFATAENVEYLGHVKILANGELDTSKLFAKGIPAGQFAFDVTEMFSSDKLVSSSGDLDYYRKLKPIMKSNTVVETYLVSICDASYYFSKQSDFRTWPGFSETLLRSGAASEAALSKGAPIAFGNYVPDKTFKITLPNLPSSFDEIQFEFSNTDSIGIGRKNVNILIGQNGVGKTHALLALMRGVTGIDRTEEPWPYFNKMVAIAYSPFENFYTRDEIATALHELHGAIKKDSKSKKLRRRLNVNSYAYVGFRDNEGVFSLTWPAEHSVRSLLKLLSYDRENRWWNSNPKFIDLMSALSMHISVDAIGIRKKDGSTILLTRENYLSQELNESELETKKGISFFQDERELSLSSGQRIYSYMLPCLMAEIEKESLVVIDEPELYLHPSLEIALLDMLKKILEDTNSYAIIATHSPVLVREVDRSAVQILRKAGGRTIIDHPAFQTLGESLEQISGEVFDDYYVRKPFQQELDIAVATIGATASVQNLKQHIGDEALSYLIGKIDNANAAQIEIEVRE